MRKKQKHIIFIVSAMNLGGAQRVASVLCNSWVESGHKVTLIATFSGKKVSNYHLDERVQLKFLNDFDFCANKPKSGLLRRLICLRRMIKNEDPDIVISFLTRVNLAVILATIGINIPVVISERSYPPFRSMLKPWCWINKWLLLKVDTLVVQTKESVNWLNDHHLKVNTKVVPNPVSYPLVDKSPCLYPDDFFESKRKVILAAGRLHNPKQFDMLLKAFSLLNDINSNWTLVILGEGDDRHKLENKIIKYSLQDQVFLPGRAGNMSLWYKRADLFVLSSKFEGFPNVLLEAMAYGVPSISFDCNTGPRDMIEHDKNGVLVNPELGVDGLSAAMRRLMSNDTLRDSLGNNASKIREKFSIERILSYWNKILKLQ